MNRIEREMEIDPATGIISARYPWKPCVERMVDNSSQALQIQASMERHMVRCGSHTGFVQEMLKAICEGKVRRLEEAEIESWHGPTHYVTVFPVIKPESVSTKTRIVSNSAMRNARAKLSLNECMYAGPNALCELSSCLIFWRSVEVSMVVDLRKAYQSIHTSDTELHLRRFWFRESQQEEWTRYAYVRANFGDLAAGLILEVAKRRVADEGQEIDPVAADQLRDFSYVDDSIFGGSQEEVERMRGEKKDGEYSGTVPRILAKGALKVKFMAVSGDDDPEEEEALGGKTLGVSYRLAEDLIWFHLLPVFYDSKKKSSDTSRDVVCMDRDMVCQVGLGKRAFSRRQALSMVMGVYDPLGLVSPALMQGKLLLRRLYATEKKTGWDDDIPLTEKALWGCWFGTLLEANEVTFPRSTKPPGAIGQPRLAGFSDASEMGLCAVIYVVWTLESGEVVPRILLAKCRVAPLRRMTIPRGELQAIVVVHRLLVAALEAFPFPTASVSVFTDSLCSIGAIKKQGGTLRPFFANRVSEIGRLREQLEEQTGELCPVEHVPGDINPADVGTRGLVGPNDLGILSMWQQGPGFSVSTIPRVATSHKSGRVSDTQ